MKRSAILWLALAACLLTVTEAVADGYFAKEAARNALEPKPVAIPSQRAIVSFRDGVEKLVVESALDAEGQSFGWILPVPAKPTEYAEASPGLLRSLSLTLKPMLATRYDYTGVWGLPLWLALLVTGWAAAILLLLQPRSGLTVAGALVGVVAVGVLIWYVWPRPVYKTAQTAAGVPGVRVEEERAVGGYDVYLLDADEPGALNAWLESNGFAKLPERGNAIVKDYIRDGWRFVAARLRREGSGLCRPHPLAIEFPVSKPVYPMRLTALAESDVDLEVFVVATERASHPSLGCEASDTFERDDDVRMMRSSDIPPVPGFRSRLFWTGLGHSELERYLWDGCIVTKLVGTITPAQMDRDFAFRLSGTKPYRAVLHTSITARRIAWAARLWAWSAALIVGVFVARRRVRSKDSEDMGFAYACLGAAVVATVAGYAAAAYLPRVEESRYREGEATEYFGVDTELDVLACLPHAATKEALAATVRAHYTYASHVSGPMPARLFEEYPGGIAAFETKDGVGVSRLDTGCVPLQTVAVGGGWHLWTSPGPRLADIPSHFRDVTAVNDVLRKETSAGADAPKVVLALYACVSAPEECLEPFIGHLWTRRGQLEPAAKAFEVSALALMSRVEPPAELTDGELDTFLVKVERWRGTAPTGDIYDAP